MNDPTNPQLNLLKPDYNILQYNIIIYKSIVSFRLFFPDQLQFSPKKKTKKHGPKMSILKKTTKN